MPSSTEEILLTLGARDNASDVAGKIDSNFKGMASSVSSALTHAAPKHRKAPRLRATPAV